MTQLVYNRFRLTRPMKRVGKKGSPDSKFEPIDLGRSPGNHRDEILALGMPARAIANKRLLGCHEVRGSCRALFKLLGSPNNTDVGPVCNDAGANALWTFGWEFTNGYGRMMAPERRFRKRKFFAWELIRQKPSR